MDRYLVMAELELKNISVRFGGLLALSSLSFTIGNGRVVGLIGPNGAGKSTLLKLLLGRLKADAGLIHKGDFSIGYFDQHREMLNDEHTLIETFCPDGGDHVDVQGAHMHVYAYLKTFLFPEEYMTKKVGQLSGGEKNRVALALLFTKNVECLILDEPTTGLSLSETKKVLSFVPWSDDWHTKKAAGKWKNYPDYGKYKTGFIGLQDHDSPLWFRNIKIKKL